MKFLRKHYPSRVWPILFVALVGLLLMLLWPVFSANAEDNLPERPPISLPDKSDDGNDDDDRVPPGAHISLQVYPGRADVWSVVEWQDDDGNWQIVEGWRGTTDAGGQKMWWVAQKDFSTGPFRWTIYSGQGGRLLGTSQSFILPAEAGQVTQVSVPLSE